LLFFNSNPKLKQFITFLFVILSFVVLSSISLVNAQPPPGPPPPAAGLRNEQSLLFLVGAFILMGAGLYRTVIAGKPPQIRRLAGIDAMDEGIGIAVETGKKVHCGLTHIVLTGEYTAYSLPGVTIAGLFARKAAKAGVPALFTMDSMPSFTLVEGVIRDSYAAEGKLDLYENPDMCSVRVYAGAYDLVVANILQRENIGASVLTGEIGKVILQVGEAHRVANVFSILGAPLIDKLEWGVSTFDYVLMLTETYAAGAWVTGDKIQLGSILGSDFVTWVMVILAVAFTAWASALGKGLADILVG
jgi:hypothetical protein